MANIVVTNLTHNHYFLTLPPGQFLDLPAFGSRVISEAEWVEGATLRDMVNTLLAEGMISTSGIPTGYLKDGIPPQFRTSGTTQSVTVTTDPVTFDVEHVLEIASPGLAICTFNVVALDTDGETFDDVQSAGHYNLEAAGVDVSQNGVIYSASSLAQWYEGSPIGTNTGGFQVGTKYSVAAFSPRYVRFRVLIVSNDIFAAYDGDKHPVGTIELSVTRA